MLDRCREGRPVGVVDLRLDGDDVVGDANEAMTLERGVMVIAGTHVPKDLLRRRVKCRDAVVLVIDAHTSSFSVDCSCSAYGLRSGQLGWGTMRM